MRLQESTPVLPSTKTVDGKTGVLKQLAFTPCYSRHGPTHLPLQEERPSVLGKAPHRSGQQHQGHREAALLQVIKS